MSERGMKKWAPYKSLDEQDKYLNKIKKDHNKVEKPKLFCDEADNINEILTNYHGQQLLITYWRDGKINEIVATLNIIDPINKKIVSTNRKTILFNELISIKEN